MDTDFHQDLQETQLETITHDHTYMYLPTGICLSPTQKLWYPRSHSSQNNILSCQQRP